VGAHEGAVGWRNQRSGNPLARRLLVVAASSNLTGVR